MKTNLPTFYKLRLLFGIITILLSNYNLFSQPDTIYCSSELAPGNFDVADSLNFPLRMADPIGDINGDGLCDFVVFAGYAFNEKTNDPLDHIPKSAIITDISQPCLAAVYHNSSIQGIGDYNGDGYDDMVDFIGQVILFGNQSGTNFDTLNITIPEETDYVNFHDDITGDGNSDFIIGSRDYDKGLFVYSDDYDSYRALNVGNLWSNINPYLIHLFDYDNDNELELMVITFSFDAYDFRWFGYDSVTNEFPVELGRLRTPLHEPSTHFSRGLSDVNGDNLPDLCHNYYENGGMHLEVMFCDLNNPYYFNDPVEIEMGNKNRLVYNAGDFNNDGADDWYSKVAVDTVIMYYGNDSVADHGFNKELYYIDSSRLVVPYSRTKYFVGPRFTKVFDYNGDSISDIMLNFWSFDESKQYDTAGMVIYAGSETPNFTFETVFGDIKPIENACDGFGKKVQNIGDFNNDGFEDWAVLAENGKYINIYYGGVNIDFEYDKRVLLPQYPATECFDMTFGDLNNDGWVDIAVSHGNFSSEVRMVPSLIDALQEIYVFYGGADMPDVVDWNDAVAVLDGPDSFTAFGYSLGIPGDYNNNGYNDLVAGGGWSSPTHGTYMYYGGQQFPLTPSIVLNASPYGNGSNFGFPVTSCGDVNNDGFRDIALGAGDIGKSVVYYGGPNSNSTQNLSLNNPTPGGRNFGIFTAKLEGDFNDDGYPDLAHYDAYDPIGGELYIYKGGPDIDNDIDLFLSDTNRLVQLRMIEYIADFSIKGRSDIILLSGYGDPNPLLFTGCDYNKDEVDFILKNTLYGIGSIASGDFNNDGYTEVLAGTSGSPANGWAPTGVVSFYTSPFMVGTEDKPYKDEALLKVDPNPAHSEIKVVYKTKKTENITISICNISGKEVEKVMAVSNTDITINISTLPLGVYILYIHASGKVLSKKVVKM